MSTVEKISIDKNRLSNFHSFIATKISESELRKILERNIDYFNLVKEGLVLVAKVKFELVDGIIMMRTFSKDGIEAAMYSVRDDYSLYIYKQVATNKVLYSNNGLRVVEYEEDENGDMRYVIWDEDGFDVVGESLAYEDAVSYVDKSQPCLCCWI